MQADKTSTIVAAVALSVVGVFGLLAAPILVSALVQQLGLSEQQAGTITALEMGGGALAALLAIAWIRKVSWRRAALLAIAVVVGGNLLSSMQTEFLPLAALRFAVGFLGQGTAFAVAIGIISDTQATERNFAFSITAQVVFGVLAFFTLPTLALQFGIAGIFVSLAGLALLSLATLGGVPTESSRPALAGGDTDASIGPALVAMAVLLIWCTGLGSVWAFLQLIGEAGGLSAQQAAAALGISTASGTMGALAAAGVADRFGRLAPVALALVVQMAAMALLTGEMSFLRFAATAAVFQIFWNFTGPYVMGSVAISDTTGRISVAMPAAQTGGFAIGAAIGGSLVTDTSLAGANYAGIALLAVALVLFIPTALRLRRAQAAQAAQG